MREGGKIYVLSICLTGWGFDVVMSQIQAMAEDAQPLLSEFRDSGLLKEVESLTRSLTQASDDMR